MLISDIARKVPSETSAIRAMAGLRLGQRRAGDTRKGFRDQVGDQDAGKQAGDEKRQLESEIFQPIVEQKAENGADMDGKNRIQKVQMVDPVFACLLLRNANIQGLRLCRFQLVARDKKFGDRPTHQTGKDKAECGAGDTDLHGVGDPVILCDSR